MKTTLDFNSLFLPNFHTRWIYRVSQKTWEFGDELDIVFVMNFKSHNIIMSARVNLMKRVNDCKDVSIMSPQDEQWRRTSSLCKCTTIFLFYFTTVYSQNINTQIVNIADKTLTDYSFLSDTIYTKELFEKTISNSSQNSHVYWDTLYNIHKHGHKERM